MTKRLCAALAVIAVSVGLAAPASATPISFAFAGTVTDESSGSGMDDFFPDVAAGIKFAGTLTFGPDANPNQWFVNLRFLNYEADGYGGRMVAPDTTQSLERTTTFQRLVTPAPVSFPVNVDWIRFSMDAGWKSGELEFLAQGWNSGAGTFENALWHGDITSVQQVPEPATLTLGLMGFGAMVVRRYRSGRRSEQ
jgi:PEP-CTERM motif-containing protein